MSSLDDDIDRMHLESTSSEEEVTPASEDNIIDCYWILIRDNNQQAERSANEPIISSKKRKDLRAMSEDAVLAALRKSGNNNQDKQVMRQKRK